MKKMISIFAAVLIAASTLSLAAYAVDYDTPVDEVIIDEYEVFASLSSTLSISGSKATYSSVGRITNYGTISVTHSLEKYSGWLWNWDTVSNSTFDKTKSNSSIITLSSTRSGLSSGTYRVKSVFTVTSSVTGVTETVTIYSTEKTVS